MQFTSDNQFSSNFGDFLSNSVNKNNVCQFPSQKLLVLHGDGSSLKFVVPLNDAILTNVNDLLVQNDINYCTLEEADPRLIRHAINQTTNGLENITIQTVDSDVLVLSLSSVERLIQADVKSIFIVFVRKKATEEF